MLLREIFWNLMGGGVGVRWVRGHPAPTLAYGPGTIYSAWKLRVKMHEHDQSLPNSWVKIESESESSPSQYRVSGGVPRLLNDDTLEFADLNNSKDKLVEGFKTLVFPWVCPMQMHISYTSDKYIKHTFWSIKLVDTKATGAWIATSLHIHHIFLQIQHLTRRTCVVLEEFRVKTTRGWSTPNWVWRGSFYPNSISLNTVIIAQKTNELCS